MKQTYLPRFSPFREVASKRASNFLNEAIELIKEDNTRLIEYGLPYKKSSWHERTVFTVAWLKFKADLLITVFRLQNGV